MRHALPLFLVLATAAPAKPPPEWARETPSDRRRVEVLLGGELDPATRLGRARALLCGELDEPATRRLLEVLATHRTPGSEPLGLRQLALSRHPHVRQAAARLLGEVGGPASHAALREAAERDPDSHFMDGCFPETANARAAAAGALEVLEQRLAGARRSWMSEADAAPPPAPDCADLPDLPEVPRAPRPTRQLDPRFAKALTAKLRKKKASEQEGEAESQGSTPATTGP